MNKPGNIENILTSLAEVQSFLVTFVSADCTSIINQYQRLERSRIIIGWEPQLPTSSCAKLTFKCRNPRFEVQEFLQFPYHTIEENHHFFFSHGTLFRLEVKNICVSVKRYVEQQWIPCGKSCTLHFRTMNRGYIVNYDALNNSKKNTLKVVVKSCGKNNPWQYLVCQKHETAGWFWEYDIALGRKKRIVPQRCQQTQISLAELTSFHSQIKLLATAKKKGRLSLLLLQIVNFLRRNVALLDFVFKRPLF